ncbi:hypothetical protein ACJX0J_021103, partial [Zea mays]
CMSRTDLKLDGSFADMILIPDIGVPDKSRTSALFISTNPGQLNFYDGGYLFFVQNSKEGNPLPESHKFPVAITTFDPNITITGLYSLTKTEFPNISLKKFCARKNVGHFISENMKWPLTGYQDGSVRIWDATFPILMPMFVLDGNVADVNLDGANASVSSLAFCPLSMTLAVGTTSGLVRSYILLSTGIRSIYHFSSLCSWCGNRLVGLFVWGGGWHRGKIGRRGLRRRRQQRRRRAPTSSVVTAAGPRWRQQRRRRGKGRGNRNVWNLLRHTRNNVMFVYSHKHKKGTQLISYIFA